MRTLRLRTVIHTGQSQSTQHGPASPLTVRACEDPMQDVHGASKYFASAVIYLEMWSGQVRRREEELVDACRIWSGEENLAWSGVLLGQDDLARSGALMVRQDELLALGVRIKRCHNLDFLRSLLLCNNLTQACQIHKQWDKILQCQLQ